MQSAIQYSYLLLHEKHFNYHNCFVDWHFEGFFFFFSFQSGGMKGGTFDPYPSHSADPYVIKKSMAVPTSKERKIFYPPPGPRSRPVTSIITLNVTR